MLTRKNLLLQAFFALLGIGMTQAQRVPDYDAMSLGDLMDVRIKVASMKEQTSMESPGVITVISGEEIRTSGARDLMDILETVPGFDFGMDVQGVLGYEVFSRFVVIVDYEQKRLTLIQPEYFRPKRRYQALNISIQDTKPYIVVPVEMANGASVTSKLLVDSGASHGLMLDPASNKLIVVPEKHVSSLIGRGLGGLITGQIGRIKSLALGKYKLENVVASFPDANSYIDTLKASDVFRNGSVCGEILSRFTTIYNFSGEKMYLKKNSSYPKKFYFNMSGLTIKAKGARLQNFEITDVRKDSEAEKAGLVFGDLVLSINGLPTSTLNLNSINGYFDSSPGKRIKLEILRNTERLTISFVLVSPI